MLTETLAELVVQWAEAEGLDEPAEVVVRLLQRGYSDPVFGAARGGGLVMKLRRRLMTARCRRTCGRRGKLLPRKLAERALLSLDNVRRVPQRQELLEQAERDVFFAVVPLRLRLGNVTRTTLLLLLVAAVASAEMPELIGRWATIGRLSGGDDRDPIVYVVTFHNDGSAADRGYSWVTLWSVDEFGALHTVRLRSVDGGETREHKTTFVSMGDNGLTLTAGQPVDDDLVVDAAVALWWSTLATLRLR